MRFGVTGIAIFAALFSAACNDRETKQGAGASPDAAPAAEATIMPASTPRPGEAKLPAGGLPPFAERSGLDGKPEPWLQQLEPDETDHCSFTEKPVAERPRNLVVTAWSGNLDLLTDGYVLGHDPGAEFVEAMWMKRRPVVAARAGLPDLWIEPLGDFTSTILRINPDELTCVQWEG